MNKKVFIIVGLVIIGLAGTLIFTRNKTTETGVVNAETKQKVEAYVRQNISTLSPEPAVLGGTYYVTAVVVGNATGTVSYEDGHVAHTASFAFSFNNDEVNVTDFNIQQEKPSFVKEGNIVRTPTSGWQLVYEEPGKPALTLDVQFTEASLCTFGTATIQCMALSSDQALQQGMRVRIEGKYENADGKESVIVSKLIKL